VSSLSETVTRQRRDCDLNPGLLRLSAAIGVLYRRFIVVPTSLHAHCVQSLPPVL